MTSTLCLADRFRVARDCIIDFDGREIHSVYALGVPGASELRIRRHRASSDRAQGLRIAAAVDLLVNGHRTRDLILRSTTAPSRAEIGVDAEDRTIVYVWNTWTIDNIDHAWLGNAGMRVETDLTGEYPSVRFSCSDGLGEATFDDLVVSVEIVPRVAVPDSLASLGEVDRELLAP